MSPQEALAFLDSVCGQIQLNRDGHAKVQQAINVLGMVANPTASATAQISLSAKEMTAEKVTILGMDEALAFLDSVCGQLPLSRDAHSKVQQAINVLGMAIGQAAAPAVDVIDVEVAPGNSGKDKSNASTN